MNTANAVVGATEPIVDDFRKRLGIAAVHIANAFDPQIRREDPAARLPSVPGNVRYLVHTGKLSGVNNRDPTTLFQAMRDLSDAYDGSGPRLRLVLAGRLDSHDLDLVRRSGLGSEIILMGELPHTHALDLQRQADAVVLIASPHGLELTGKLFEYLAAGVPILALGGPTIRQTIADTATGVAVAGDDLEGIRRGLAMVLNGQLRDMYAPRHLDRFLYPGPAVKMAELLEVTIAQRRRSVTNRADHRPASAD